MDVLTLAAMAAEPVASDSITKRLLAAGMADAIALEKRSMFRSAATRLLEEGLDPGTIAHAFWCPGRIEIAGKHTDYAGGRSLLAATSRGFALISVERSDDLCRIFTSFGLSRERKSATLQLSKDLEPQPGHWSAYPAAAIRRLVRNFEIKLGVDIALECDLPEASGMSTSSAVICYMWTVLSERNKVQEMEKFKCNLNTSEELYSYLGFIENGQDCGHVLVGDKGVGTFGGSEDHTAIMSSEPGRIKMFSYCPTKHEGTFDFPSDATFVIAVSGALAEKTGDAMADYNNAAFLARDAAVAWCDSSGTSLREGKTFVQGRPNLAEVVRHVRAELGREGGSEATAIAADGEVTKRAKLVVEGSLDAKVRAAVGAAIAKVDDGKSYGPNVGDSSVRYKAGALRERFEQYFDESEVMVGGIAKAFSVADYATLGELSDESHRQTVECLRNTVPETAWLPREARRQGALAASAFGAGFGGSCWALVKKENAKAFTESWMKSYHQAFPRWSSTSVFFEMTPGPGAFKL